MHSSELRQIALLRTVCKVMKFLVRPISELWSHRAQCSERAYACACSHRHQYWAFSGAVKNAGQLSYWPQTQQLSQLDIRAAECCWDLLSRDGHARAWSKCDSVQFKLSSYCGRKAECSALDFFFIFLRCCSCSSLWRMIDRTKKISLKRSVINGSFRW